MEHRSNKLNMFSVSDILWCSMTCCCIDFKHKRFRLVETVVTEGERRNNENNYMHQENPSKTNNIGVKLLPGFIEMLTTYDIFLPIQLMFHGNIVQWILGLVVKALCLGSKGTLSSVRLSLIIPQAPFQVLCKEDRILVDSSSLELERIFWRKHS